MIQKSRTLFLAAAVLAVAPLHAQAGERLTDMQYVQAVRCQALAGGLGVDTSAVDAVVRAERSGRHSYIAERASEARRTARRDVARAEGRARAGQELAQSCSAWVSAPAQTVAGALQSGS